MAKKPSASQITHGLAQLGGGAKKDGGDGMMGGMKNIAESFYNLGQQHAIQGQIGESSTPLSIEDKVIDVTDIKE